ncbi:enoyl-CoA hydratase/isomerase family protein [Propionicimonas sp.]|uniref:enoyl-CoA hydratase/isomerase family protein n=1 Tax=Propionicimonas sp. TaxID=1955623 RepID=UPI0039E51CEB
MSDSILLDITGGLARITLNRPASLNAVDSAMAGRWREVARQVVADPSVGAVLVDAAGTAFCAGGDVVHMARSGEGGPAVARLAEVINEGIGALVGSDRPVVAAVQGAVAGGGLGLMLTADYIVASASARFVSKYADIGLTPDLGTSTLLSRAIGERRALQLLLSDRALDAGTALDWGLVTEVVAPADVAARAGQVARSWLDNATGAFGQAKRLVRAGASRPFAESLADEAATIGRAFDTDDARARVAAFAAGSGRR